MSHSQFTLLKTRRFLPLFLVQFLGAFNDNVFKNALVILVTYSAGAQTGVDPRLLVTAAAGIFILPFFLFSATAGAIADAWDKAKLIRIIKAAEIVLMAGAAAGFMTQNVWLLMAILFLTGTQSAFFGPIKYSILPDHLKEDELIGGNALVEAGTFLAILLGTIFGGLAILRAGGDLAVSLAVLAVAAGGFAAARAVPPAPATGKRHKIGFNIASETWRLVQEARKSRDAFLAIIGISWFWLVGFTFLAQFPVYARDVLNADETVVTLFLTVFSVGIAIGSLVCEKMLKGKVSGVYVPLGAIGMTAGIFAFWLASPDAPAPALSGLSAFLADMAHWPVLGSLLAISIFGGIYIVPLYAIMQTRCAAAHRSRTIAVNNVLNALFMVIGAILTMFMLELDVGIEEIFLLIGIANIPVAALVRRVVRKTRENNNAS